MSDKPMTRAELKRIGARKGKDGRLRREYAFGKHTLDEYAQRLTTGDTTPARPGTKDKGLFEADVEDMKSPGPLTRIFTGRRGRNRKKQAR